MSTLPYSLQLESHDATSYYHDVKKVIEQITLYLDRHDDGMLEAYTSFMELHTPDPVLSDGEYALDLIITGTLWRNYHETVLATPRWTLPMLEALWRVRRGVPSLKGMADRIRALLFRHFISLHKIGQSIRREVQLDDLGLLIRWLGATGEFREEAKRVECCRAFLDSLSNQTRLEYFDRIVDLADFFAHTTQNTLGAYTASVEQFRSHDIGSPQTREDILLRTRPAALYHLSMVGAELMNDGLRREFSETEKTVVLLPGCMRPEGGAQCRALREGPDLVCQHCNSACAISRTTRTGLRENFRTVIILHSGSFSKTIRRWAQERRTGVIASACLLNLLPAGYELRRQGLHAQCIPLNFCGCKKHWQDHDVATSFESTRLRELLGNSAETEIRPARPDRASYGVLSGEKTELQLVG